MVERLACALLSNARGVWRCLCLEAPYMSTICTSEFLKALEVFLHTHAAGGSSEVRSALRTRAEARRWPRPSPTSAHPFPPSGAELSVASAGNPEWSRKTSPASWVRAASAPNPSAPSRPCLPRPTLDFHSRLLQGPDTPPQFPTSPFQLQITAKSEAIKGTYFSTRSALGQIGGGPVRFSPGFLAPSATLSYPSPVEPPLPRPWPRSRR